MELGQLPTHYRLLFSELGRNTPVYGIIQSGGDKTLNETIQHIVQSGQKVTQSIHSEKMLILLQKAPVIGNFLCGCPDIIPTNQCMPISFGTI